ncbi:MAG: hypothetical protein R3284_03795 [Rubricoccaceae bacterium]|nr:hypothetical protein [Rubricoccaceae bacterium]
MRTTLLVSHLRHFLATAAIVGLIGFSAGCDAYQDVVVIGNDIIVRNFSFSGSNIDVNQDGSIGSYHREVDELTSDIVDDGAVLLYADGELILDGGAGTWTALPFTQGVDIDDDLIVDWTLTFTYSYDIQDLYVDIIASATGFTFDDFPRTDFKLVLIPGNLYVGSGKAGIDYSNYEAVRQAYGIAE